MAENTWSKETEKWEHLKHLRISKIMGDRKARLAALNKKADIYVISRDNVIWLVDTLGKNWPFKIVVIDELSSFKNPQAKRFKALKRVRGLIKRIIGLTGTPRPNGIEDLWPEIFLLDAGERLGKTITSFRMRYLVPDKRNGHIVYSYRPQEGAEELIYEKISDICMSIKKEDVLSLPGQIYTDVVLDLPDNLLKQYKTFEREKVLECIQDGEVVAGSAAALTNKLLQYANGAIYDEGGEWHLIHDVKLEALCEMVEAACGEPVIIMYAYKHDEERIRERIECRALDTPQDIDDWNAGKIPVALAHPASCSHGLNLQEGGHIIIWFGLPWSWELYAQANERLNRPGQTQVCRIYHLMMKGTHDERVLASLQRKENGNDGAMKALVQDITEGEET